MNIDRDTVKYIVNDCKEILRCWFEMTGFMKDNVLLVSEGKMKKLTEAQ